MPSGRLLTVKARYKMQQRSSNAETSDKYTNAGEILTTVLSIVILTCSESTAFVGAHGLLYRNGESK